MSVGFDPGYCTEPFISLCSTYPDEQTYPADSFRVEWGPIFHRGRLDGSARVLVLGQDPAQHETIVRRILIGEAGRRTQGFLSKLGIDTSYVMVNTFLYSVYGQQGGEQHKDDPGIVSYRNQWLDALLDGSQVEVVVALGQLADDAFAKWKATPAGQRSQVAYQHITHPTEPESSSGGDPQKLAAAIAAMLANWNAALQALAPQIRHPDTQRPLVLYGTTFGPNDRPAVPVADFPAGLPVWMSTQDGWAARTGATPDAKRATITVSIPQADWPWKPGSATS
jgi:uracil-DNA glycosylase